MNILDTDALSLRMKRNAIGLAIEARMRASADPDFWITAISAFEMVDDTIALHKSLKKRRKDLIGIRLDPGSGRIPRRMAGPDSRLRRRVRSDLPEFCTATSQELGDDTRIAAIALAAGGAVWTCNVDDFKRVPGLTVYGAETGLRVV